MARRSTKEKELDINQLLQQETITDADLSDELSNAMLNYAIEVIADRAIPRIEDGLKPVQRRILWTTWVKKYLFSGPFIKCAKITGDVMGDYHPHGWGVRVIYQ